MDPAYDHVFNDLYEFRSNRDDLNRPQTFEPERIPPDEAARAVQGAPPGAAQAAKSGIEDPYKPARSGGNP